MVLRAAALYGHDPRARSPPKCSRCVASIQTVEAAQAEIEHVNATRFPISRSGGGRFDTGCAASQWCGHSAASYRHRPAGT